MPIFTFLSRFHGGARSQYLDMRHRLHYVSPMKKPPKMLCWFLMSESLRGRKYREEIDFIKAHTGVDMLLVMPETGVITEDYDQCHSLMADLVGYAHSKGIGITLYVSLGHGFFNGGMDPNVSDAVGHLEMFTIKRPEDAQGLAVCGETIADADGCAAYTHEAKWARSKIRPLRAKLLRVFAFDKAGDGFYVPGSLADVTDRARIVECRTHSLSLEIDAGREHAGKTIFVVVVQYYNWPELFGESEWAERKALMDVYAGIPLDGVAMDEYGYMLLRVRHRKRQPTAVQRSLLFPAAEAARRGEVRPGSRPHDARPDPHGRKDAFRFHRRRHPLSRRKHRHRRLPQGSQAHPFQGRNRAFRKGRPTSRRSGEVT